MNYKLIETDEPLQRGSILRCKGKYPYENYVDFMIIEQINPEKRRYSLLVISGYKAGLNYVTFPDACLAESKFSVCSKWLKENWANWGYFESPIEEVYIVNRNVPNDFQDF